VRHHRCRRERYGIQAGGQTVRQTRAVPFIRPHVPGEYRDEIDAVEVRMLRSENLTIEIFIDEDDDGTTYAETLMFTTKFRRLLARGYARLEPMDVDVSRISDERIAAVALLDLVRTLNHDKSADYDDNSGSAQLDRWTPTSQDRHSRDAGRC
jgi:hypothetical protein